MYTLNNLTLFIGKMQNLGIMLAIPALDSFWSNYMRPLLIFGIMVIYVWSAVTDLHLLSGPRKNYREFFENNGMFLLAVIMIGIILEILKTVVSNAVNI